MTEEPAFDARTFTIDSFGGIQPMHEAFYLEAILYSGEAALRAINRFQALARPYLENGHDHEGDDHAAIVSAVHEALNHCGGISKVFWTPDKRNKLAQARAAKLRTAFGLDDTSALNNRALRNALEHFDERLDDFLMESPVGMFFPGGLVAPSELADERPGQIFRLVDPWARVFVVFNEKYPFQGIFNEAQQVSDKVKRCMESGGRLPRSEA